MKRLAKTSTILLLPVIFLALSGCVTVKHNEQILGDAGFRKIAANSDQQISHLMSLPADKLTIARINGKPFYVFPDPKKHVIYVGNEEQYNTYKQLSTYQQLEGGSRVLAVEDEGPGDDTVKWATWTQNSGWSGGSYNY